jgi:hypothetical protein
MGQEGVSAVFHFVRTDPVQEVAAEPATLTLLMAVLRSTTAELHPTPVLPAVTPLAGWPLVNDVTLPAGEVHCRPTPGAPPPLTATEIEEYMRELMPTGRPKENS